MQWDETMAVGVDEIDHQHQGLINLINEAYEAIQRHDEHILSTLIDKMKQYATHHFATEERYMAEYNFPDLEKHKLMHAKFNTDVDGFQQNLFKKTNLSQIFIFLSRWLTNHIMEEDKKYVGYMPIDDSPDDEVDI